MTRFLSPEWLAEAAGADPLPEPASFVLEQVVTGGPDGTVVYRVEVAGSAARVVWPVPDGTTPADLRISVDWPTAAAVAQGRLSTQRALMQGRLRVSGTPDHLAAATDALAGADPVPTALRARTTFGEELAG